MAEPPALRPDLEVGETLGAIARHMLADVAGRGEAEAEAATVHSIRRGLKRWRAFLRLLMPAIGPDATTLRHEARDLARALAGARDLQAALDALDDLGEDYTALSARSLATVKDRVITLRESAEISTLTPAARESLWAMLAHAEDAIESWPLATLKFEDLAGHLAAGYERARNAVPSDWATADAETLHELRGRTIDHRYQMELIEPVWPRLSKAWIGEAQRLRDQLGKHQDLVVLAGLIAPKQPLARWRSRLIPAIEARQHEHVAAAMRHAARLYAEKPKAFRKRLEALWTGGGT